MKICRCCKSELPLSLFYKHSQMADGHLNKCKSCVKARVNRYRMANIDKIREYDRNRGSRQTPEYIREYRRKYPNKYNAHKMVGNAIRGGKLFKQPCEVCGVSTNIHAHHDDYRKPLNVRWLCASHHSEWHKENGEALNP